MKVAINISNQHIKRLIFDMKSQKYLTVILSPQCSIIQIISLFGPSASSSAGMKNRRKTDFILTLSTVDFNSLNSDDLFTVNFRCLSLNFVCSQLKLAKFYTGNR